MANVRRISESISKCDIIFENLEDMMSEDSANDYRFHYMKFKRRFYDLKRYLKKAYNEIKKIKNENKYLKNKNKELKNKIEELENQNTRYIEQLEFEIKVRAAYHRSGNKMIDEINKLKKEKEDTEELKSQLKAKNTFLIEKHLTSKYAKWLVEYNKQKRAT